MANPVTVFEHVTADVIAMLNASRTSAGVEWPVATNDDAYNIDHVEYVIGKAAEAVASVILGDADHPARDQFLSESAQMTHGQKLPQYIGLPGDCFVKRNAAASFRLALPRPYQAIQTMRDRAIFVRDVYFTVTTTSHIFFTGTLDGVTDNSRAKIWLGVFDVDDGAFWNGLTGDVIGWIRCKALADLFPRGGHNTTGGSYFDRQYERFVMSVQKKKPMPQFVPPDGSPT